MPALPPLWLLAAAAWVGPFGIHFIIPSIPRFPGEFGAELATAQGTLTAYLIGIALGQLVYGPVSDRIGRRPAMLAGLGMFAAATLGCALAWSIEGLIALRALQGAAGCAGQVLGRAIIRDCRPRDQAASLIGYLTVMMALGASFSPFLGGLGDVAWGWRLNFALLALAGAALTAYAWRRLGETRQPTAMPEGAAALLAGCAVLLRSRLFVGYALSTGFAMGAWFGFVAGAPHVLHAVLGLPVTAYGAWILLTAFGYIVGNFCAGRFSVRLGGARMMALGQIGMLAAAAAQVALWAMGVLTPLALFLPMTAIVFASGLFLPNANAGAISVRPEHAGAASGLIGFMQMGFAALATLATGKLLGDGEGGVIAVTAGATFASALALLLARGARTDR